MDNNDHNGNGNDPKTRGDAYWDEKSLMDLFNRAVTPMRRYPRHWPRHHGDPHRGQGRLLSILKIKPDISQKDLGYLLDMRGSSLGELLVKLERAGYITRTPAEEDRRIINIHLTERGAAAAEQAEKRQADTGRLFDCLSQEEQASLSGYLKRLIMRMDEELSALYEAGGTDYDYDPFWGVGPFKDGAKACCRQHRHDAKEQSQAIRGHIREHSRRIREEMREHSRELREEMRHDPRLKGFFWGGGPDGCGN